MWSEKHGSSLGGKLITIMMMRLRMEGGGDDAFDEKSGDAGVFMVTLARLLVLVTITRGRRRMAMMTMVLAVKAIMMMPSLMRAI